MSSTLVIDCSVAMAWCFADEETPESQRLAAWAETGVLAVPSIWWLEVTNVTALAIRKRRLSSAQVDDFIDVLAALNIDTQPPLDNETLDILLPLCQAHRLTSYDAAYLEVALRRSLPLITLDAELRTAARKAGVSVTF